METNERTVDRALVTLLKEPFEIHTANSIAKAIGVTRQGVWKALNKLAEEKLVSLEKIRNAKTSAIIIKLSFENSLAEKILSLILTKEALKQQRWVENFSELKDLVKFFVLFGSILNNPKEANDIDVLAVVDKKNFKAIDKLVLKIQSTQLKRIHLIDLTEEELNQELKKSNKAYINALKKGIVLYGQDNFVRFAKELKK